MSRTETVHSPFDGRVVGEVAVASVADAEIAISQHLKAGAGPQQIFARQY